jgi:hypothetical protein
MARSGSTETGLCRSRSRTDVRLYSRSRWRRSRRVAIGAGVQNHCWVHLMTGHQMAGRLAVSRRGTAGLMPARRSRCCQYLGPFRSLGAATRGGAGRLGAGPMERVSAPATRPERSADAEATTRRDHRRLDFGPFGVGLDGLWPLLKGVPSQLIAGAPFVALTVREHVDPVTIDALRGRVHRADVPPRAGPGVRHDPGEREADGGGGPACRSAWEAWDAGQAPSAESPFTIWLNRSSPFVPPFTAIRTPRHSPARARSAQFMSGAGAASQRIRWSVK